jgi:1-acyl-sn-glycerol-3-phosphate acyltransferase
MTTSFPRNLRRAWRIVGTVIFFSAFGLGGLSLSLFWIPLLGLATCASAARHRRIAQLCIHASFKLFATLLRAIGIINYRVENAAALADDAGCIIVANHPTLIDYVLLVSLMRDCDCVVKEALWKNFFMRGVIRHAGYIPNRDAGQMLAECHQKLDAGGRILIFPEGTRSTPGQPMRIQRGAANIAVRCRADLRVVHITCEPLILSKRQKWWASADSCPMFRIRIGEKIRVAQFLGDGVSTGRAVRLLNENLYRALSPPQNDAHP